METVMLYQIWKRTVVSEGNLNPATDTVYKYEHYLTTDDQYVAMTLCESSNGEYVYSFFAAYHGVNG